MCKIIAISNCKGGVGKTTSTVNLGAALFRTGKKVVLIDNDPQGNLTMAMGLKPDSINNTLGSLMLAVIENSEFNENVLDYVINRDGVDVLPSNIMLSALETRLINAYSREFVLKTILDSIRNFYDYILIDCGPSLGMLTINALTAADSVIIPVESHYLCYEGLQLILNTIKHIKKKLNNNLSIEGIIFTMYQSRTNLCKGIRELVRDTYGDQLKIFDDNIAFSVKAAEQSLAGKSIFDYDPKNSVAVSYNSIAKELIGA